MTKLPADIEVFESLDSSFRETVYRLPRRPPEAVKLIFRGSIIAAASLAVMPFIFSIFFAVVGPRDKPEIYLTIILLPIVFFGTFLFPLATVILLGGLTYGRGRVEIRCGSEHLKARSGWGLLRWTRRLPLAGLTGFRVVEGILHPNSQQAQGSKVPQPGMEKFGALMADYQTGKSQLVCAGYANEWLVSLAEVLTERCEPGCGKAEPLRPVTIGSPDPNIIAERSEQPSTSNARLRVEGDTLIIDHPARGFWRGVPGFLKMFGLFWNGFMVMWTCVFMPALFAGEVQWNDGPEKTSIWFGLLFCTPFYLIGFGFLAYFYAASIYAARWSIRPDELELWERKLLGERTKMWLRSELSSIRVVTRQNNDEDKTWSTFLQISTNHDRTDELFSDRDKSELEWLATTLRKALGLPGADYGTTISSSSTQGSPSQ